VYQRRFRYVTIVPDEERGTLGHCRYLTLHNFQPDLVSDSRTRANIERFILTSYG
jgi:hypothetical protein